MLLAGEVAGVAWFALAARLTGRVSLSRRVVATLVGTVVLLQVLVWTNPVHSLVYVPRAPAGGVVLGVEYGVGFWIHAGGAYLLGLVGTGLFALEALQSTGVRRTQTLLLALAAVPIVVANLASTSARRPGSSSPRSRPRSGRSSTTPTNWTPR